MAVIPNIFFQKLCSPFLDSLNHVPAEDDNEFEDTSKQVVESRKRIFKSK